MCRTPVSGAAHVAVRPAAHGPARTAPAPGPRAATTDVLMLFLYAQYGRGSSSASSSGPGAAPGSAATDQQYRERRDQQAKWERRYRRERPFEARRQERGKSK